MHLIVGRELHLTSSSMECESRRVLGFGQKLAELSEENKSDSGWLVKSRQTVVSYQCRSVLYFSANIHAARSTLTITFKPA